MAKVDPTMKMKTSPVQLYHSMTIKTGSRATVTCVHRFSLDGVTLPAKSTITIEATRKPITVKPLCGLGAAFARGWASLPTELKVHILRLNLVTSERLTRWRVLEPYLLMTPEIKDLSTEIFYSFNKFHLAPTPDAYMMYFDDPSPILLHPPLHLGRHIRSISTITCFHPRYWRILRRMASGGYGLPNLRFVEVQISCWYRSIRRGREWASHPYLHPEAFEKEFGIITFRCKGEVKLLHLHSSACRSQEEYQALVSMLPRRVVFEG